MIHLGLPFHEKCSTVRQNRRGNLPTQLRLRRISPLQFKHFTFIGQKIDFQFPFAFPLHMEVRRFMVV